MKLFAKIFALFSLIFSVVLVGCSKSNQLDVAVYCKNEVNYTLYNSKDSQQLNLSDITTSTCTPNKYSVIQITTNKDWTYGLTIEKIQFELVLSELVNVDLDITITNLENAENIKTIDKVDTRYFHKTIAVNQTNSTITLDINDVFINKDSTISIEVVKSCYENNPNLNISIGNLKMFGQHTPTNY